MKLASPSSGARAAERNGTAAAAPYRARADGVGIFDNLDLGALAEAARRLGRYDFLLTATPLRIRGGIGSPLNPLAVF